MLTKAEKAEVFEHETAALMHECMDDETPPDFASAERELRRAAEIRDRAITAHRAKQS